MVRLNPHRVDRKHNNTPVLFDREIDDFAQAVLAEYRPSLLREPGAIDFQHFLESYCGMQIEFKDLYSDDPERPILAMTVFKTTRVKIFDKENECVKKITVPGRRVLIDNSVMEPGRESLALFSGMHEGGHIKMHWHVHTGETLEGDVYDPDYEYAAISPVVCCRRENIESNDPPKKVRTAKEWLEHHADYFAAAITMPNRTFIPFVRGLLRENSYYRSSVTLGVHEDWDILVNDIIPDAINEVYGVSKRAARIKLRKANIVLGNL